MNNLSYQLLNSEPSSNKTVLYSVCKRTIEFEKVLWYQFMLIPATLCVILFAFLRRRRGMCMDFWKGRPGLPRPLHFLDDRHNRLSFVGGFSVTIWMLQEITLGGIMFGMSAPYYAGFWLRVFASILTGIICYPIFGGITSDHVAGYAVGTIYIWTITVSFLLLNLPCENGLQEDSDVYAHIEGILRFIKFLPCFFWLIYLSCVYPYRLYVRFMGKVPGHTEQETDEPGSLLPYLLYVRRMLLKREEQACKIPAEEKSRWKNQLVLKFAKFYKPLKGFRHSVSILSAVFVSILLVYTMALTFLEAVFRVDASLSAGLNRVLVFGRANETEMESQFKYVEWVIAKFLEQGEPETSRFLIKVALFISIVVAFVLTATSLLLVLRKHRKNLLYSYKGVVKHLPAFKRTPRDVIVDSLAFVGYQFAFAIWGFIVHTLVITALIIGLGVAAWILTTSGRKYQPWRDYIHSALLLFVYVYIFKAIQHTIVYFCFLQRNAAGKAVLALDNRSWFVNFQYFMVFPHAAIGLVSCLIRIVKATFFSMWVVPRLDQSTLARQFEDRDRGFKAYVGLLMLESSLTNPTMLTFVYLLLKSSSSKSTHAEVTSLLQVSSTDSMFNLNRENELEEKQKKIRSKLARNRWFLYLMLEQNPILRFYRKRRIAADHVKESSVREDASKKSESNKKSKVGDKSDKKLPGKKMPLKSNVSLRSP